MTFGSLSRFAKLMTFTLASMAVWLAVVWFLGGRLGVTMPLTQLCFVAIAVELVRWLPISLQGIGVREGAFAGLFHILGYAPGAGLSARRNGLLYPASRDCAGRGRGRGRPDDVAQAAGRVRALQLAPAAPLIRNGSVFT